MGEERCREGFVFWEVIMVNRDIKNWVIDCLDFLNIFLKKCFSVDAN